MKTLHTARNHKNKISGNGHFNGRQKTTGKLKSALKSSGDHLSLRISEAAPKTLKIEVNRERRQQERKTVSPWLNPTQ